MLGFGGGGSDDGYYGGGGGGGGGGGSGYSNFGPPPVGRFVVQMRGLPYRVTENDIAEVSPLCPERYSCDILP